MRIGPTVLSFLFFAAACLALHGCALLTVPLATAVIGGTQLAIKGAELQKEIKKADAQAALDASFKKTWDVALSALTDLDIEIIQNERNQEETGGIIGGLAKQTRVEIVVVKLTKKITEIGIWASRGRGCFWTSHDKALAGLIAEKIKKEAQGEDNQSAGAKHEPKRS